MDRPEPVSTAIEDDPRVSEVVWNADQYGTPIVLVKVSRESERGQLVFCPPQLSALEDPHAFMIAELDAAFAVIDGNGD